MAQAELSTLGINQRIEKEHKREPLIVDIKNISTG